MDECTCHISPPCDYCTEGELTDMDCPECGSTTRTNKVIVWCDSGTCEWQYDIPKLKIFASKFLQAMEEIDE